MTRLPAPLRQLCSSLAPADRRERWGVGCDGRVDVCWRFSVPAVLAGSGGNDDDYVFTVRRFVAVHAAP
jgi:hypothetical protein